MKKQDLRIGNLLYFVVDGSICKVIGIGSDERADGMIESANMQGDLYAERPIEDFLPIPLTPFLLIDFGFHNQGEEVWWLNDFYLEEYANGEYGLMEARISFKEIKYVHELQNLYFALTGEELKEKALN